MLASTHHLWRDGASGRYDAPPNSGLYYYLCDDGAVRVGALAVRLSGGGSAHGRSYRRHRAAGQAFKGFSDDIVIIVGSALVVSAAVARSGVIERVARWLGPYLVDINRQIVALVGSVTLLSAFVKNVGALAMLMPIAFQLARRTGTLPPPC